METITKYSKGQRVSSELYASEKGRINNIMSAHGGYQYYEVLWDDGSVSVISENELQEEKIIKTAFDLLGIICGFD